jgi:hypothetical protein
LCRVGPHVTIYLFEEFRAGLIRRFFCTTVSSG